MKIRSIEVDGFGTLVGRSFVDLSSRFVVVFGPNEAGKSTLLRFIASFLYGFSPAKSGHHPYAPWTGELIGGAMEIDLDSGETYRVERKLLSVAKGIVRGPAGEENLANRRLSFLPDVSREIFESVYALSRKDLRFPKKTWPEMRDRMIGGSGLERIRSARSVASDIEGDARKLWSLDRRAKPESGKLEAEITRLGEEAKAARQRDGEIRLFEKEIEELDAEKRGVLEREVHVKTRRRRITALFEYGKKIESVKENEKKAGDLSLFRPVEGDPRSQLNRLRERIDGLKENLEKLGREERRCKEEKERFTPVMGSLLDKEAEVREAIDLGKTLMGDCERLTRAERDRTALEARIKEKAKEHLDPPDHVFSLPSISSSELRHRISRYREAAEKAKETGLKIDSLGMNDRSPSPLLPSIGIVLGVILLLVAIPAPFGLAAYLPGCGVLFVGVHFLLNMLRERKRWRDGKVESESLARELEDALAGEGEARDSVKEYLEGIPALPSALEDPDEAFARALEDLERFLSDFRDLERGVENIRQDLGGKEKKIHLAGRLAGLKKKNAGETAHDLDTLLEETKEMKRSSDRAEKRLAELKEEIPPLREKAQTAREDKDRIEELLLSLKRGEIDECIDFLLERRKAAAWAEGIREDLAREEKEFDRLVSEIEEAEKSGENGVSEEEIARLESEESEISGELQDIATRIKGLEKDIETRKGKRGAADIEGEREEVREELERVRVERDRLSLLAGIIGEGDRRYREEHEPDILKRAGEYLSTISGGRYRRLHLEGGDEDRLEIEPPKAGELLPIDEPISRGTLDQIFISLRLALVDHLEGEGETLPLFLDEVLVHWDEERSERGLSVFERVVEKRQVFFFTCRREIFSRLCGMGATAVDLTPAEGLDR